MTRDTPPSFRFQAIWSIIPGKSEYVCEAISMAFLKVLDSPDPSLKDQTIPLSGKETSIGRGKENGLVLEDHAVSRHHAKIVEEPDGHVLVDNNSANGSWVNGQRVSEMRLKPGDQIRLGKTLFEIQGV